MILAIDPGTYQSAYAVLDYRLPKIEDFGLLSNEDMLPELYNIWPFVAVLAVEMVASYGMPVGKSTFETVFWAGRFWQASRAGKKIKIYRQDVKLHLCKNPRANDSTIRQAIIDHYGPTKEEAIGGKKCQRCKGKTWVGRDHEPCPECDATGWKHKPGPLYGVSKDVWAAIGVGLTAQAQLKDKAEA